MSKKVDDLDERCLKACVDRQRKGLCRMECDRIGRRWCAEVEEDGKR